MNKIAFFGASVTQQKFGYWKYFSAMNTNFDVKNFGYGGRQIWNAGVCYIDEVLEFKPDYCFVDWFSTAFVFQKNINEIKTLINTIAHKFFSKNVKLIFLTLPNYWPNRENVYRELNDYLLDLKIPSIDLFHSFKDLSHILRDEVHTTKYGAEQYAKIIADRFMADMFCQIEIPNSYPSKNKYCDIKKIDINSNVSERMLLDGNCHVISFAQVVGPHSGLVNIGGTLFNNWDGWCYYERDHMKLDFDVNGPTPIEILQDNFDRSACKYECDWSAKKMMKIKSIYYIGDELKVLDYL